MTNYQKHLAQFLTLCCILFSCSQENKSDSGLLIGLAEVSYNPPVGCDLVGNYRGNDYASRGVHDSLYARALVVENRKNEKVALLTVDICKLPKESITMMREYIASHSDIKEGNILIHATHTHSGPKSDLSAPHAKEYLTRAATAVVKASKNLQPGKFMIGKVNERRVSFNRRLLGKDGKVHMCWEKIKPDSIADFLGPADPGLIALLIIQNGISRGALINFGCHATTLTGNNWLYSADYPGMLAKSLKDKLGSDFIPLFFNGCCGNVTQVDYRRGFIDTYEECERIGNILGIGSMMAIENSADVQGNDIVVSKEMVPLKRMTITDEQYNWAQKVMDKVKKEGMPPLQANGIPDAQFATLWMDMYKTQNITDSLEVMTVRIGDLAFVGLPGEIFSEFGMDIKARSPLKNTIVMGLANDARKYFPTQASFEQGPKGFTPMVHGYETTPGSTLYDRGSGEKLAESAIKQLLIIKNK
jgi:hypothetical protein